MVLSKYLFNFNYIFFSSDRSEPLHFHSHYNREGSSTYTLHCTAYFGSRSRNVHALSYADEDIVQKAMSKATGLTIVGLIITPRTVGARIKLSPKQVQLWRKDDHEDWNRGLASKMAAVSLDDDAHSSVPCTRFHPTAGPGSRAHITLGYVKGFSAVQTGLDQVSVIKLEAEKIGDQSHIEVDGAAIRYYGQGRCAVYFNEPVKVPALFSGKYV